MKPARQTSSTPAARSAAVERGVEGRAVGDRRGDRRRPWRCRPAARARPAASRIVDEHEHDLGRDSRRRGRPRSAPACWCRARRSGSPTVRRAMRVAMPSTDAAPARPPVRAATIAADRDAPSRRRASSVGARRRRHRSGATTTIMPMPQLKVRAISASATPPVAREPAEHRRHRPGRGVDRAATSVGQHARHVLEQAAAGDVRQRLDARRCGPPRGSGCT